LDELTDKILQALQNDFPLREKPYDILAAKLGISTDELWQRVHDLISEGVIRRLGASLDSRKLGCSSTLAAVRVPAQDVNKAADVIDGFPEVTHCYLRDDDFNIWFTVIAENNARISAILDYIRDALSLDPSQILNLPAKRFFKLDAAFKSPS
jgi:siroheme decarboxylase